MNVRRAGFISPRGMFLPSLAFPATAIRQLPDAESDVCSLIATGRVGPSQRGRTASRIPVNGAVPARACIQQNGRSVARTGDYFQVTFNNPPAADPSSRRQAI